MRQNLRSFVAIGISIYLALGNVFLPIFLFKILEAEAAVPLIVNYQGRLQNASGSLLGTSSGANFDFRFSIWNTSTTPGGTQLWPSSTPPTVALLVRQGLFHARIGDTDQGFPVLDLNFNTSSKIYLQIEVYNATSSSFETLAPRQPILSSGFAINADTVDGASAGTSSNNILLLDSSGNINLPGGQIRTVNTSSCSSLAALGGGSLCYDTSNNNLYVFNNASSSWVALGGSSSTGSSLQQTYDIGNVVNATSSRDITFNLTDTAVDPNFIVSIATTSASAFIVRDNASVKKLEVTSSTITLSSPTTVSSTLSVTGGATSLQGLTFSNATTTGNLQAATLLSTGNTTVQGALSVTGLSSLGNLSFQNATSTGNLQVATFVATGQTTLASASSTNFEVTGSNYLRVGGQSRFASVSSTNLSATGYGAFANVSSTNVSSTNVSASGYGNFASLVFTNASGTNLTASGFLQGANLNISGQSTLATTTLGNASGTNFTASGFLQGANLNISGQSALASVSSTNQTLSGYLVVSGVSTLATTTLGNASGTNVTASGFLQGATLNISGQTVLASASTTNLEVTGANYLRVGTGATTLGGTLNVTGQTTLGSVSSTALESSGRLVSAAVSSTLVSSTRISASDYGNFATLFFTNASGTNLNLSGFFGVTGRSDLGNVSSSNLTASGFLQGANLNISGVSTLATTTLGNASGTNFTASGFLQGATLNISGQSTLASVSSTNQTLTGYLTVSGVSALATTTLGNASGTNITASGFLQGVNLNVSGQSALATVSSTNLEVTGTNYLRVGGQTSLQSGSSTAFAITTLASCTEALETDSSGRIVCGTDLTGGGGGAESGWRGDATFVNLTTSTTQVGIGATSSAAKLFVQTTSNGTTTVLIQGKAGQTADLLQVASSSGLIAFQITNLGVVSSTEFRSPSSTITAFAFTNASGTNLNLSGFFGVGGRSDLGNVSSSNVTASGFLQGGSLNISGQSTLSSASTTNLEVTGSNYLRVGGVSDLQGVTFVNATGTGNLQVATLRTTGNAIIDGRLAVGTTTFTAAINIASTTTASGGIAGIFQDLTINPTAADGFQFGNRMIVRASTTATTTAIGSFIRMIDNTSLGNTVRGLEVQAYSGTNSQGVNSGIISFGRTFGVQGITTGEAGGVSQPAGVYAELQNQTQGNALRAYSATSTTATLVSFFHEVSNFSGTGLLMNLGNAGGSFTGNFLNLQRGSTTRFVVNATGTVVIGSSTAALSTSTTMLLVCAQSNCTLPSTVTSSVAFFASIDGTSGTNSIVAKGTVQGGLADVAEYVAVTGKSGDYEQGDLLSISTSSGVLFEKSAAPYDLRLAGIVTPSAAFVAGGEVQVGGERVIMSLAGRVLVKVNGANGAIEPGDPLTSSPEAGEAMKAAQAGRVVGIALEAFEGTSATSTGKILILVNPHWYVPQITADTLQGGEAGTGSVLNTFTFDPDTVYSFEHLRVQNLEVGKEEKPSGITIYDVETKSPYCVFMKNGVLETIEGKCKDRLQGMIPVSPAQPQIQNPPAENTPPREVNPTTAATTTEESAPPPTPPDITTATSTDGTTDTAATDTSPPPVSEPPPPSEPPPEVSPLPPAEPTATDGTSQ